MRYAIIKNNHVKNIIEAENEEIIKLLIDDIDEIVEVSEQTGPCYMEGEYINGKFRKAQPYPSWTYDEEVKDWVAPIPYPEIDGNVYVWDEEELAWKKIDSVE